MGRGQWGKRLIVRRVLSAPLPPLTCDCSAVSLPRFPLVVCCCCRWIYHHYLSMLISLIMLLWPNPYLTSGRIQEMLWFGLVQGLVMLFQNNYQKKRLYVRKTLGKAKAIDTDSGETLVEKPTDLAVLIPMLFSLYTIELWFGVSFIRKYLEHDPSMRFPVSVLVMGLAFIVLAVGNAWTTGIVLVSKSKTRALKQMVMERVVGKKNRNSNTQAEEKKE